jgi:hypothetical protein
LLQGKDRAGFVERGQHIFFFDHDLMSHRLFWCRLQDSNL